jgi:hypothetical protein
MVRWKTAARLNRNGWGFPTTKSVSIRRIGLGDMGRRYNLSDTLSTVIALLVVFGTGMRALSCLGIANAQNGCRFQLPALKIAL